MRPLLSHNLKLSLFYTNSFPKDELGKNEERESSFLNKKYVEKKNASKSIDYTLTTHAQESQQSFIFR